MFAPTLLLTLTLRSLLNAMSAMEALPPVVLNNPYSDELGSDFPMPLARSQLLDATAMFVAADEVIAWSAGAKEYRRYVHPSPNVWQDAGPIAPPRRDD